MAFPSVKLTTLASLAHRLPAACWLAQRLEQAPERWVTLPVWWVEGDLDMAGLDLVTTLSSDGQWLPPLPSTALDGSAPHPGGALLWVDGHLRLQGALTGGWHTPASAAEPSSPAVHALVMGDAQVHCALLRQGQLHVQGNLSGTHIAVGRWRARWPYGAGPIHCAGGAVHARVCTAVEPTARL